MTLTKITLTLLIIKAIYCESNVSEILIQIPHSKTTECLKAIIQKYFPCGFLVTLVIDSNKDGQLIKSLNSETDCYSFIVRSYIDYDWFIPTPMYVIRARDITEFSTGILTLVNDLFWNPRGRFIIELETLKKEEVNTVFQILMDHKVYDVILIRKSNDDIVIDTYYPFKYNNCGKKVEVATIGDCKDLAALKWFSNENVSLRNCTIRVAAIQNIPNFIFESTHFSGKKLLGLEQLVLESVAEKEGLQLSYMLLDRNHSLGVVLQNHTATGLLGTLQNDDVDIAAGGFILIKNRIVLFDFIWAYNYAAFQLFTPAAGEEIWKDVYKEFTGETWILIFIAYCLIAFISTMRQRLLLNSQNHISMALKLWGYFFLNTSSKLSKDKTFRMIMVFWVWFTFFIYNFYNTELYSLLTGRSQTIRDMNVDRLRELPYEPCISISTRTYYLYAFNHPLPEGRNIPECEFTDTAFDYVVKRKNAYAIEMDYSYTLAKYKYINEDGIPQMDTWSFSINNIITMYITRGFALRDKFQNYALRLYESGIIEYNLEEIYRMQNHNNQYPLHKIHSEKIRVTDLRIHFSILLLGCVLSSLCLVFEILWYHYSETAKAKLFFNYYRADWNY